MRIIFFTQEDPFYVKFFFDVFLANFTSLDEIRAIVISRPMGKKSTFKLARQMYDFYGLLNFVRMGLRYMYAILMGKRRMHRSNSEPIPKTYTIKQLAEAYGLNIIERNDLNSKDFLNHIGKYDADLFISVASPIIFKQDLIKIPKFDCINIHNAPLPKYRGMLPSFWQLYHDEKEAGITVHRINGGIDAGDIISQTYVPIVPGESLNHLILKTKKQGAKLMIRVIDDFRERRVRYKKMAGRGSYFSFPTRKNVRNLEKRGKSLF